MQSYKKVTRGKTYTLLTAGQFNLAQKQSSSRNHSNFNNSIKSGDFQSIGKHAIKV